ncbi:MAG: acyltransferase [Hyphomicrobiales bacterium]|nr:acyltransferase [Hyphomicrobiales bacterium]
MPPKMPKRFYVLDTYRFFGACAVMIGHFAGHFHDMLGISLAATDRLYFVDFFFALSGFVLMHAYGARMAGLDDFGRFMTRRFARLYPLHLFTTLAMALAGTVVVLGHFHIYDPASLDLKLVLPTLLLLHAFGVTHHAGLDFPSWSLSAELLLSLLFPLMVVLLAKGGVRASFMMALLAALVMALVRDAMGLRPWYEATYDGGAFRAVPMFFAGMAVEVMVRDLPRLRLPWAVPHLFALGLIGLMLSPVPVPAVLPWFVVLVALLALCERDGKPSRLGSEPFIALGNTAFAVFLLHTFVAVILLHLARALHATSKGDVLALICLGVAITIGLGLLSYRHIELPLMNRINAAASERLNARLRKSAP